MPSDSNTVTITLAVPVERVAAVLAAAQGSSPVPAPPPTTPAVVREMMSPAEAAALLGVSIKTLEAWRAKGKGPAYTKIGALVRYRRADLVGSSG